MEGTLFSLVLAVIKACGFLKIQVVQESKKINLSPSFYFPKGKKLEVFVSPVKYNVYSEFSYTYYTL